MTRAVHFVVILGVRPAVFQAREDIIGVQISVRALGARNNVNGLARRLFKYGVRPPHQRIGNCLKPFGKVAVLEYPAAVFAALEPRRNLEVAHTIAGFGIRDLVVQRAPLVGDQLLDSGFHEVAEKESCTRTF